jgi:glycosyltransferase involved in cell wall biosynthesis
MNGNKIKVLVVMVSDFGGVAFYRSIQPHEELKKLYGDEFEVVFDKACDFENIEKYLSYDIIHFHKGFYTKQEEFFKLLGICRERGIKTIIDVDDYWSLGSHHPSFALLKSKNHAEIVVKSLGLCDYVTTTTDLFADKIRRINENVVIFPNSIDPTDERFIIKKKECDKLRVGMVMGSTHLYDLQTMQGFVGKLSKDIIDKVVFVLCGFDTRGSVRTINKDTGLVKETPINPKDGVWAQYEKILTENYKYVTPMYKSYLLNYIPNAEYPYAYQEGYKRRWTLPINEYFKHYEDVDVLLAPLEENLFNFVKSDLKVVECAFSDTVFIGSNYGPYSKLVNFFGPNGTINENGNAILIDKNKAHKDWSKAIEKLVKNPSYVEKLKNNLRETYKEKYDLRNITKERRDFYKKITNR